MRDSGKIDRAILDSLTAHIAVIDNKGVIVTVNQAWENFGRENQTPENPSIDHSTSDNQNVNEPTDLPCMFPGLNYLQTCRDAVDDPFAQQAFQGIRAVLDGISPQFKMEYSCHSPYENRWFLLLVTPLARYEYSGGGAVVSHLDISERHKAEIERAQLLALEHQAREIAETANRSKDEFLAIVSHELRTPLHSISGWVEILGENDLDESTKKQALEIIKQNVRVQARLVDDLLDVSRIVAGKMSIDRAPLELQSVAQASIQMMQSQAQQKSVVLCAEFLDAPQISGDAQRIQQIICNLIQNAIKFSPPESEIRVRLEQNSACARLTVSDQGEGITADFLPRIFNRFEQADASASRKFGGMGLGLSIVEHLVVMHEGIIEVFSDGPGQGSQFVVELPLLRKAEFQPSFQQSFASPQLV